jgi:hypothetical protein
VSLTILMIWKGLVLTRLVFETELVSIQGVEPEEKVVVPKEEVPTKEEKVESVTLADDLIKTVTSEDALKSSEIDLEAARTEPEAPQQAENPQEELEKEKVEQEKTKDEL